MVRDAVVLNRSLGTSTVDLAEIFLRKTLLNMGGIPALDEV